jgi:hypothetical protein
MNMMQRQSERIITQILSTNSAPDNVNDTVKRRILALLYIQERKQRNEYFNQGSYLYTQNQKDYGKSFKVISESNCHITAHYVWFWLSSDVWNKKWYYWFNSICDWNTKIMTLEEVEKEIGFPCILQMREEIPIWLQSWDTIIETKHWIPEHSCIVLWRDNDNDIIIFEQRWLWWCVWIRKLKQIAYWNVYSFSSLNLFWWFDNL